MHRDAKRRSPLTTDCLVWHTSLVLRSDDHPGFSRRSASDDSRTKRAYGGGERKCPWRAHLLPSRGAGRQELPRTRCFDLHEGAFRSLVEIPLAARVRDEAAFDHPIARQDRGHSCAAPSSQWRAPLSVSVLNGRRRVAPRSESHVQSVMLRVATVRIKLYVHVYLDTDRTPSGLGTQHVGRAVQPAGIAARAATAVAHEQTGSASIAACCRASCLKKMGLT